MIASMRRRLPVALAALLSLATLGIWLAAPSRDGRGREAGAAAAARPPTVAATATTASPGWELPLPTGATGWEEAAETVALDLRRFLLGRAAGGAYEEARAEAARADLAAFPPEPGKLRRLLLSPSAGDRTLALAALAARGQATDDLVRIALRCARPEEDELLRLLAADLVAALPPEQLARHEDDLLRAFEREPNPLVLAVALPALERLEAPRLRALLEAQLAVAAPEMLPVLAALARDRLGPEGLREIGVLVHRGE
jgi:hypothetical protein